jgi:proteic killer suppression protein
LIDKCKVTYYICKMIEGFKHKELKKFYEEDDSRKLPPEMVERIRDILTALDAALAVEELNRPSFRLHPLKGALKGNWAVTVRASWRIIFRFANGAATNVDFIDYH